MNLNNNSNLTEKYMYALMSSHIHIIYTIKFITNLNTNLNACKSAQLRVRLTPARADFVLPPSHDCLLVRSWPQIALAPHMRSHSHSHMHTNTLSTCACMCASCAALRVLHVGIRRIVTCPWAHFSSALSGTLGAWAHELMILWLCFDYIWIFSTVTILHLFSN